MTQQSPTIPTLATARSLPESETLQIQLSLEGDLEAFSDLTKPYRPMFYQKVLSIVRKGADAEDVTQTALLKAFTRLSQFRLDSQFRIGVASIVINEALMCLRARRRCKQESLDHDDGNEGSSPIEVADPREGQSHALERKHLRAAILKAVSRLPLLLKTVFILRDLRLLSISDTAKTLGITETVSRPGCGVRDCSCSTLSLTFAVASSRSNAITNQTDPQIRSRGHGRRSLHLKLKWSPSNEVFSTQYPVRRSDRTPSH